MPRALAHHTRALLATLMLLAVAVCMPHVSRAATFKEFGTRCADGDTSGSFIEITGTASESTRNGMRLRAYDRNGVVIFDMDAYGARGGQVFNFQEGGRSFLFLTAPMIMALGGAIWGPLPLGYADNILPFALDPVGGRLMLYLIVNGREQISAQVRYGPGQSVAPPPGMSAVVGSGGFVVEPHPLLDSFFGPAGHGITPSNECYSAPDYHLREVRLQCEDGNTDGQYLLIDGLGPIGNLHETVTLTARDHTGALLGSTTQAFANDPSAAAFSSRRWLVGGPGFFLSAGADTADARLPFVLDPAGGSLELTVSIAGLSFSTDAFVYGSPAVPLAAAGLSYVRQLGQSLATRAGNPFNSHDVHVELADCAAGSGIPRLVVQEFALECTDGRPSGQFVELSARGGTVTIDPGYRLQVYRRDGTLAFTKPDLFAGLAAAGLDRNRNWLLVPARDPRSIRADGTLLDTLDRSGGALELWHDDGHKDSLQVRFEWGPAPLMRPVPGGSLDGSTLTIRSIAYPTPTNWSGVALPHDDCTSDADPVALSVLQAGLLCVEGSDAGAFVELDRLTPEHVHDARLGLRWLTSTGVELARVEPLFPPRSEWPLGNAPHWLVAGPGFESRTLLAPDVVSNAAPGETPVLLQLFRRDPVAQVLTPLAAHSLSRSLLGPGRAEVRLPSGSYESGSVVSPQRFDGARAASGACWSAPHPEAVRLSSVLLQCREGSSSGQFVQLDATGSESMYSRDLLLRVRGRDGREITALRAPFPADRADRSWPLDRALLIGTPGFAPTYGLAADATLPTAMDTIAGRIELVLAPSGLPEILLDAIEYGPGGIAPPPPGAALETENGIWRTERLPRAEGITTVITAPNQCLGECPGRSVRFAVGGEQSLAAPAGRASDTGAEATYDGPRGTFALASSFRELALRWDDRYVIDGLPAGQSVLVTVRVRNTLAYDDTCLRQPSVCIASLASVTLSSGAARDSLSGAQPARDVQLPLTVRAGEAFDLLLSLRANAVPSPLLPASTRARLEFSGLPEGAYVRSCNGFDSRLQRGIGTPVVTAEARRMNVAWPVTGDADAAWAIERRVDEGDWQPFETRSADADHVLRVVDTRVTSGHSYAYRTGWSDEYGRYASAEATSQPVNPPGFAFEGVTPNPNAGVFSARFEIPEAGSVQLDVLDVAGRVIASQRRWLEAGRYTEPLAQRGTVAPGVYTVRMTYRGLVSWSRVVVLR